MAEEIFDVVNEADTVVGQATRVEVHRRGLLHRAIHVLVFNPKGEVFLQKRSLRKDRHAGLWDSSASGHVDSGEDYDHCALRELNEEIGLVPAIPPQRLFKLPASPDTDLEHVWVYRCAGDDPLKINLDEIETGGWVSPQKVDAWLAQNPEQFASTFRIVWRRVHP
jgi:isopentenyldiphosphate isomerase